MSTRHAFIKQASVAGAGLWVAPQMPIFTGSPNEKVVIGTMSTNSQGSFLTRMFAKMPNVEVGYVWDVRPSANSTLEMKV